MDFCFRSLVAEFPELLLIVKEWPRGCLGWQESAVIRLCQFLPFWVALDGCRYDLTYNQMPVRKPWLLAVSQMGLEPLGLTCQGTHDAHYPCHGEVARTSAFYTDPFVRRAGELTLAKATAVLGKT